MRLAALAFVLAALSPRFVVAQSDLPPPPLPIAEPLPPPPPPPLAREVPPPPLPVEPPASSVPVAAPQVAPIATPGPAPAQVEKEPATTCSSDSTESLIPPPSPPGFGFVKTAFALGELTKPSAPGVAIGLGIEKIDRDLFLDTLLVGAFELGPVHLGIQAPLRWRVGNLDDKQVRFQLRKQDWDEVSDYFRILRYAEYGTPGGPVYARAGELAGTTLGHGTLVNAYYNTIDIDHWQTGVRVNVNLEPGGAEAVLQSVSSPRLGGGRLTLRPWYFVDRCSPLYRLTFGASVFLDARAPTTLHDATLDAEENLHAHSRTLALFGTDVEYPVFVGKRVDVTPYADLSFIGGEGAGFHGGVLVGLHPPIADFQARLEYRRLGARYLPSYFDALYEMQRFLYRDGKTKLEYLDQGGAGSARNGFYSELAVSVGNAFSLLAAYADDDGPRNSGMQLRLLLPEILGLRLGGYYIKCDFEGLSALFDRDGALGMAEARYSLSAGVAVIGQLARQWKLRADGTFDAIDTFNVGFQVGWTF